MATKQRERAMQVLNGAYRHLSATRYPGTAERALTIIAEASRKLRNPQLHHAVTYEWFNFDTPKWDGNGLLYAVDSIEVL